MRRARRKVEGEGTSKLVGEMVGGDTIRRGGSGAEGGYVSCSSKVTTVDELSAVDEELASMG